MRPKVVLLVALIIVSASILAAGCVSPGGDGTQPPPTETITTPTDMETPIETETIPTPTDMETPVETETTAAGGSSGY